RKRPLVAVFGVVGLILQLRGVERDLRSAARGHIYDMAARLKEVFAADPDMRRYFFDGETLPADSALLPKAIAVADYYYCLYLEQITTQSRNIAPEHRKSWLTYASAIYHRSPI